MRHQIRLSREEERERERLREEVRKWLPEPEKNWRPPVQISSDHYIRLGDIGNPTVAALAGALTDLIGHNIPLAVTAGVLTEFAQRNKHLSEEEGAVLDVLRRLAQGGSIYEVWIEENDLLDAMNPDLDLDDRRRVLARMKSRGLLQEGVGWWRAVF